MTAQADSQFMWDSPVAVVPGWLITADVSDLAVRLYALLALGTGRKGPTKTWMAEQLGVTFDQLNKALAQLQAYGAVAADGRNYRLNLTAPAELPAREPAALPVLATNRIDKPPMIPKVDGRNLPLDAICGVCGIDPAGPRINQAVAALHGRNGGRGITHLFWTECQRIATTRPDGLARLAQLHADEERYARLLTDAIEHKAQMIRQRQPWRDNLSPAVIRDLWLDVEQMPVRTDGGLSGDDIRKSVG